MLSSAIHAAVTAAILFGLPGIQSHLIAFDTEVIDLTDDVTDPVKTLMNVQLGGGTVRFLVPWELAHIRCDCREGVDCEHVALALWAVAEAPSLEEGEHRVEVGTDAAPDEAANPAYDRDLAGRLVELGAHVGAMTPGKLAAWIAEKVKKG